MVSRVSHLELRGNRVRGRSKDCPFLFEVVAWISVSLVHFFSRSRFAISSRSAFSLCGRQLVTFLRSSLLRRLVWQFRLRALPFCLAIVLLTNATLPALSATRITEAMRSGLGTSNAAGNISNFLEQSFEGALTASGETFTGTTLDATFTTALAAAEGAAVTAEGAAAVGASASMLSVGIMAVAGGAAVAGAAYCITEGCDVQAAFDTATTIVSQAGQAVTMANGTTLWFAQNGQTYFVSSSCQDAAAAALNAAEKSEGNTNWSGPTWTVVTNSSGIVSSCTGNETEPWISGTKLNHSASGTLVVQGQSQGVPTIPDGGLSIPGGSDVFAVPSKVPSGQGGGLAGPLTASENLPAAQHVPVEGYGSTLTPTQLAEPASPQMLADIANLAQSFMPAGSIGAAGGSSSTGTAMVPYNPVTPATIKATEQATGLVPTVGDLASTALGTVQKASTGTGLVVSSPTTTALSTIPNATPPSTATQKQAAPCGNLTAGEVTCGVTIDLGPDEWQDLDAFADYNPLTSTQGAVRNAVATAAKLMDAVNPYTAPATIAQSLAQTQAKTESQAKTDIAKANPDLAKTPLNLPFNEWPMVFFGPTGTGADFSTSVQAVPGICPTASFYSQLLGTTVSITYHCVIMAQLQPYMNYVLPPTYMLMALMFVMGA